MIGELEFVVIAIGVASLEAIEVVVNEGCAVLVVNVPVEAQHVLLGFLRAVTGLAARLVVIDVLRDAFDALVVRLAQPIPFLTVARARIAPLQETRVFPVFVGSEEEQLVLDDRTADVETIVILVVGLAGEVAIIIGDRVAAEVVVRVLVEDFAFPFIRTGFRNRVDVTG